MNTDIQFTAISDCSGFRRQLAPAILRNINPAVRSLCLVGLLLFATVLCSAEKKKPHAQPAPPPPAPAAQPAHAAPPVPPPVVHPAVAKISDNKIAPIPSSAEVVSYHAPYDAGDCSLCHQKNDLKNPGPVKGEVNELCMGCHDDYLQMTARKYAHPPAQQSCVVCHNPHDSKQPKLLLEETGALCSKCHQDIQKVALESPVKHEALTQGSKCANCHNPHGSDVEHLLVRLPMQLCLQCHSKDDVVDHDGKKLTNMGKLLADNPHQHAPVAAQDCSACHMPHGGNNFRLLTHAYPAKFYSAYDAENYALCFGCHEEKAFTEPQTEQLTQFRDGKKNLHYVHVNRGNGGRTCRACHEVHATVQEHQIRDAVPFGSKGWMLKINYSKTETGGSCAKTCHATRSYNNFRTKTSASTPEAGHDAKP